MTELRIPVAAVPLWLGEVRLPADRLALYFQTRFSKPRAFSQNVAKALTSLTQRRRYGAFLHARSRWFRCADSAGSLRWDGPRNLAQSPLVWHNAHTAAVRYAGNEDGPVGSKGGNARWSTMRAK